MIWSCPKNTLFLKNKIHGQYQKAKSHCMIPAKGFILKKEQREKHKNDQSNHFLNDFKLHQSKRSAIAFIPNAIGWNLKKVFKQSQSPTDQDNRNETSVFKPFEFFKFEMSVPSQSHEDVGKDEQTDGDDAFHSMDSF